MPPPRKIRFSPDERIARAATRMIPGTLGGRAESASPVRHRNVGAFTLSSQRAELICTFPGVVADGTTGPLLFPTYSASILQVHACAKVAPSGDDVVVDVLKNGTSIFPGSKPTIPDGDLVGDPVVLTAVSWVAGDKIQYEVETAAGAESIVVEVDIIR